MRRYPKYLKSMPEFFGLTFADIGALLCVLYLSLIFNLNPLLCLVLSAVVITTVKILRKRFDFVGFMSPRRKEINIFIQSGDE